MEGTLLSSRYRWIRYQSSRPAAVSVDSEFAGQDIERDTQEAKRWINALELPQTREGLPNSLGIATLALRFGGRDPSVVLVSEGLGGQRWHGRIAILVNEHTASAGEMVAAFASENKLATIVGTETAGRLIPGTGTNVGHGYMLIMPRAQYITWQGRRFEGNGVVPDICDDSDPTDTKRDQAIQAALTVLQ